MKGKKRQKRKQLKVEKRPKSKCPLDGTIHYLNTDLELESDTDHMVLVRELLERAFFDLYAGEIEDGWRATLEIGAYTRKPERAIRKMLDVISSISDESRSVWEACRTREFDIGYECGEAPKGWSCFRQPLSPDLLARIAAVGAGLRITIYPYRE